MLPVGYLPNDARTITLEVKAPLNERSMSRTEVEVAKKKKKKKGQSSCK